MNDTEALKALIAAGQMLGLSLSELAIEEMSPEQYELYLAANNAIPAIERMLASQTQDTVLVPREPTEDMLATARFRVASMDAEKSPFSDMCREAYKAMLSAAPVASQMGEPVPVAEVFISERTVDLCPMPITRRLREILGDGIHPLYAAPASGMDAEAATMEILAGDLCDPEHTGWSMNSSVPKATLIERIAAIIRKYT